MVYMESMLLTVSMIFSVCVYESLRYLRYLSINQHFVHAFVQVIATRASEKECTYCLPDCEKTIYYRSISAAPFRACDDANFGLSRYCNMEDPTLPDPKIWAKSVIDEYDVNTAPGYIKKIISSERTIKRNRKTFEKLNPKYDAYDKVLDLFNLSICH